MDPPNPKTFFPYTAEQKANILELMSWQEMDSNSPRLAERAPFSPPVSVSVSPTISGLGPLLDKLPTELLTSICLDLDLTSPRRFSHVNRGAKHLTSCIYEYRMLRTHALSCMRMIYVLKLGPWIDVRSLFNLMTTPRCACGIFAGWVMLPRFTRVCRECSRLPPTIQVWTTPSHQSSAEERKRVMFAVRLANMSEVEAMLEMAFDRVELRPGAPEKERREAMKNGEDVDLNYFTAHSQWNRDALWRASVPVKCQLSYYDKADDVAVHPYFCQPCTQTNRVRSYTDVEFIKHFDECGAVGDRYRDRIRKMGLGKKEEARDGDTPAAR
ncbi:hypothetical protein F5Y17DRAFT_455068 [Xylariaceae sp. FL0594]|nr:hypothetical protein F5Y17DRAFT_455068 [Xylariaceae sp. FL0594]